MVLRTHVDYPYFPFRLSVDYVLVSKTDDLSMQFQRTAFENAIRREGLIISHEITGTVCFTLISAPFQVLCRQAEKREMSFPLTNCPIAPGEPTCCISLSNLLIAGDAVRYVSVPFNRKYATHFLNYTNEVKFMSTAQRSMLTHQVLKEIDISKEIEGVTREEKKNAQKGEKESTSYSDLFMGEEPLKRKGLLYLLMEGAYDDAFILHEPSEEEPYFREMKENNVVDYLQMLSQLTNDPRKKLASIWTKWFKFQPLNTIRDYFGEQIAFYFAWQGTFISVLWVAAVIGLAVFTYGFTKSVHKFPYEKCLVLNSTGHVTELDEGRCALQDRARHMFSTVTNWFVNSFDNELNALFAVFMSIWGSVFYQIWKRNNSVLQYQWNCEEYQETEPDRPEFVGTRIEIDPVTDEPEWLYPQFKRFAKIVFSCVVVLLCMSSVVVSVLLVTLYKLYVIQAYECGVEYTLACSVTSAWLPSIMNTVSTMILGQIYFRIAEWLNRWENHRTQSEHNNALIIKMFAFSFVNNYTSLFYIAVVRPDDHNIQPKGLFGLGIAYKDTCEPGSCGSLLALQLLTHMIIKPFPKFVKDVIMPYFVQLYRTASWFNSRAASFEDMLQEKDETNLLAREWLKPSEGDFTLGEFNEKIILFGTTMYAKSCHQHELNRPWTDQFVWINMDGSTTTEEDLVSSMFAALFPLAPFLALMIGLIDLRVDAHRLIWFNRRPVPVVTTGIGIWLPILTFLQYAAVTTNAFIVAFTSDFCNSFFSKYWECNFEHRLLIVIIFQNMVFLLKYVIQSLIPVTPSSIRVANRRKRFVIGYLVEKGDVPRQVRKRKKARRAKLAWITNKPRLKSRDLTSTVVEKFEKSTDESPICEKRKGKGGKLSTGISVFPS